MPEIMTASLEAAMARTAEAMLEKIAAARRSIEAVIFGQQDVIEQALVTVLSGGHGLLVTRGACGVGGRGRVQENQAGGVDELALAVGDGLKLRSPDDFFLR